MQNLINKISDVFSRLYEYILPTAGKGWLYGIKNSCQESKITANIFTPQSYYFVESERNSTTRLDTLDDKKKVKI